MLAPLECRVGEEVRLKGYAIDCGFAISAVEFSLDGGEHWTRYDTPGTNDYQRLTWNFAFTPDEAGVYELLVRSVNDTGKQSPEADALIIRVN